MPDKLPLVIDVGVVEQLQSGDVLINQEGTVVHADAAFATTEVILRAKGTGFGTQLSLLSITDIGQLLTPSNVKIGSATTGDAIVGAIQNVLIGDDAGSAITEGVRNVCVGGGSTGANIIGAVSGDANVGIGYSSIFQLAEGDDHIGIGRSSCATITTGNENIFIGFNTGLGGNQDATANNSMAFGTSVDTIKSNQIVIGNSTHDETVLKGGVGVKVQNGTTEQNLFIYETFTSDTNYAALTFKWASGDAVIGTEDGSGGGTAGALILQTDSTTRMTIDTSGRTILQQTSAMETGNRDSAFQILDTAGSISFEVMGHTLASGNIALGFKAGDSITSATNCLCIGHSAGTSISTGINNFCLGHKAGIALTTGASNVYIGVVSGEAATTGNGNTGVGESSLITLIGGASNLGLGNNAGRALTTGSDNVCIGANAGHTTTIATVSNVTLIGGGTIATGDGAIAIGKGARAPANSVAIGTGVTAAANQVILGEDTITATLLRGDITIEDTHDIVLSTGTGTSIGTAVGQKLGFWGTNAVVQPADVLQAVLTNNTTGSQDGTLAEVLDTSTGDRSGVINDNFTDIHTLLNEIRDALVDSGLMKGAAV